MIDEFEGSKNLRNHVGKLIEDDDISTVIETGTRRGDTTVWFAEKVDQVVTIEIERELVEGVLSEKLGQYDNVENLIGDTRERLGEAIRRGEEPILFYLDAHDTHDNPIESELGAIKNSNVKSPTIVIHDSKVPSRPDLGYNQYASGVTLEFSLIKDLVEEVYDSYTLFYNADAPSGERGTMFITGE